MTVAEAVKISALALTAGEERFKEADALLRQGKTREASEAFEKLRSDFRSTWIDRVSSERLARLAPPVAPRDARPESAEGIAARYPGDAGIERDPQVLFAESFETGSIEEVAKRWGEMSNKDGKVISFASDVPPASPGHRSLQMTATLGENSGGHLYTRLSRGADQVFARFYVKFAADGGYIHHFVTLGGYNPPTAWPQGGAGGRPRGGDRLPPGI